MNISKAHIGAFLSGLGAFCFTLEQAIMGVTPLFQAVPIMVAEVGGVFLLLGCSDALVTKIEDVIEELSGVYPTNVPIQIQNASIS